MLEWAAWGGMHLTGWPQHAPRAPTAPVTARLRAVGALLDELAGAALDVELTTALFGRAALMDGHRQGRTSVGGSSRLLAAADGWVAVTLARQTDLDAVGAIVGQPDDGPLEPWVALGAHAATRTAAVVAERAQLVGVPAAALDTTSAAGAPARVEVVGRPTPTPPRRGLVVDLSAMWAGPLCAHVLGRAGARVVKVESPSRADGARTGDPAFFDWLHEGHRAVALDLGSARGASALGHLLERADVVIESSRPRALEQLGLDAAAIVASRPGRTWVSITGYGRRSAWSNRVAFGDDAAIAGGLAAVDEKGDPVFCGDAMADPVTGLVAALAALASQACGGGHLVDVALCDVARWLARPPEGRAVAHPVVPLGHDHWVVRHGGAAQPVVPPRRLATRPSAEPLGASTGAILAELGAAAP